MPLARRSWKFADGAFYVFPRVDKYYGARPKLTGSVALAEAILEEANVAVVPGAPFGSDAHVRLSYACSSADIEKGMERINASLRRKESAEGSLEA